MAGNYADPLSWRMPYDKDGSVIVGVLNGASTVLSATRLQQLNDETPGTVSGLCNNVDGSYSMGASSSGIVALIFPEKRDLAGYYMAFINMGATKALQWSPDSTNGTDGAWNDITNPAAYNIVDPSPGYRTLVTAQSVGGVKAIRHVWSTGGGATVQMSTWHLYGGITAGENPDRLSIWDPVSDVRLPAADLDWGDVPRSSSADVPFRIKNLSPTLAANNIVVGFEALTDTTPSVPAQHLLSSDGISYTSTLNIAAIAPGGVSPVLTLRRVTPSNANLGLWSLRIKAEATTWS